MALSMAPPVLGGYSLRVQLFSPNAHTLSDKPIRAFRVVTSPEATVRDFCQEASRIHQINYGEPLAIKKCQDDQEFDITQGEILGHLFTNAATIRVIQAASLPGIRDSVPPTSALRFEPTNINGKRGREGRSHPNGTAPSTLQSNKRQRVSDLDPDLPLPSRERDAEVGPTIQEEDELRDEIIIPEAQQRVAHNGHSPDVRDDVPRIPETPSPSPAPALFDPRQYENGIADHKARKSAVLNLDRAPMPQVNISSHSGPASEGTQTQRSKSASYDIHRATERGTSVSTAATSPLSGHQQAPTANGIKSSTKRKVSPTVNTTKTNGMQTLKVTNEDSIYETVPEETDGLAILRKTKEKLKHGSPSGLPGLEWANKFNTPQNGSHRTSRFREIPPANRELSLTPNSKDSELHQKQEADEVKKARMAAAEAAEQRKRDADECRAAEEEERMRKARERFEREQQEKRMAVIAKAALLERERIAEMEGQKKLEAEKMSEENRREQMRIQKEAQEAERLERQKQARIEQQKKEMEKLEREKVKSEEAKRLREAEEKRRAKEVTLAMDEMRKSREKSREKSVQPRPSSLESSRSTPIRPQSSTAFIPSGRKSALKPPSSQAGPSSLPALARTISAGSSNGVGNEAELSSTTKGRRVSFDMRDTHIETPSTRPTSKVILPPSKNSPLRALPAIKSSAPKTPVSAAKTISPQSSISVVIPAKKPITPIPLPPMNRRSMERTTTPLVQSTIALPRLGFTTKAAPKNITPAATKKSASPAASSVSSASQKGEMPSSSRDAKVPSKYASSIPANAKIVTISSEEEEDDDSEEEEDDDSEEEEDDDSEEVEDNVDEKIPNRAAIKALNTAVGRSSKFPVQVKTDRKPQSQELEADEDENENENEGGDVDMESTRSSGRDSRSPVVFTSHPSSRFEPARPANPASDASEGGEDDMEEDESADGNENGSEEEGEDEDMKLSTQDQSRSSPPCFTTKPTVNMASQAKRTVPSQRKNLVAFPDSPGDDSLSTQAEVDNQLTSSIFEVPNPYPSSAVKRTPIPVPSVPSSSSVTRPNFKIGASLTSLNASRPNLAASSQAVKIKLPSPEQVDVQDSEEQSEEEDSEDDSSSDEEDVKPASLPKPKHSVSSNSSSDDASSSYDEEDTDDEMTKSRNELSARIAQLNASNSQGSTQSWDDGPVDKFMKSSSQKSARHSRVAGRDVGSSGAKSHILKGYHFNQLK